MDLAAYLDQQLRAAGVPIIGVRVGNVSDRSTWTVIFDPAATQAQKDNATSLLGSVATDAPTLADVDAQTNADTKAIKVLLILQLWGRLGSQPSAAQISAERARFVTIYKALP